jgi:hypothetical protein
VTSASGPAPDATPNGSWVKVRLESTGSTINWYLNGALVDSYDNSGGFYTAGNIFLGLTDPFNSVNPAGGVVIDNVAVVPEPTSSILCVLCSLVVITRRSMRRQPQRSVVRFCH